MFAWVLGLGALALSRPLAFRPRTMLDKAWWPAAGIVGIVAVVGLQQIQATNLERTWQHFAVDRAYDSTTVKPVSDEPAVLAQLAHTTSQRRPRPLTQQCG